MKPGNKIVLYALAAFFLAGIAYAIFDDSPIGPDPGEQEKVLLKCLKAADFTVKSEIPPAGYGNSNPEYDIEVREDGDPVAYIYLFDYSERADAWIEDARLDAENEDRESTLKRRGTAAVALGASRESTATIHRCIDKSQEPPDE